MQRMIPKPEQQGAIDKIVSESTRAALVAAETGWGKTLSAVEVARGLNAQQVLCIAPLNTFGGWAKTVERQELGLDVLVIDSKKAGLANADAFFNGEPGFYVIGREFFHLSATTLKPNHKVKDCDNAKHCEDEAHYTKGRAARWHWSKAKMLDLVILDESHSAQNRYANMATALKQIPKSVFKLAMSATPAGNRFEGIWNPTRWLWPTAKNAEGDLYVDNSKWRWAAKWGVVEADHFAGRKVTGELNPGAFVASLPCYIRYEAPRVKVTKRRVRIELTAAQRTMYDEMERDALTWLGEHPLVAELPIVQKTRLRQIGLGEVTFNEDGEVDFDPDCASAKADACELIIYKHHPNDQIIFWTTSRKFAHVLAARLPNARAWTGDVSKPQREKLKTEFLAGTVDHLVVTIPSMAEGVDGMQDACHTEVWLDKVVGNPVLNEQAAGRLNRQGQEEDIISYELVNHLTDDEARLDRLVQQTIDMREVLSVGA